MNYMTDTRKLILALKQVRDDRGLNIDQITEIVSANDPKNCPSRSSIARVFAEGSEDDASHFRFDITLKPICNALLDVDVDEKNDTPEDIAFKSLLRYKKDLLDDYERQNRELKEENRTLKEKERKRYNERMEAHTKQFEKTLDFVNRQIELKDKRIDMLMLDTEELRKTNNQLIQQLLELTKRKED